MTRKIPPAHPGTILLEEFIQPLGLTQYRLAKELKVEPIRISRIIRQQQRVTPDTALRLARYFGTTAQIWLDLQSQYDLEIAKDKSEKLIQKEVKPRVANPVFEFKEGV